MLTSSSAAQARSELEAALQIRPDASQRNNLAGLLLVIGDMDGALRQVSLALEQYPDFAAAHVTLANVHRVRMEHEQVEAELQKAEQLDPDMPLIPMVWAQYHAGRGQWDEAISRARDGVEMRPDDTQVRLMLAKIYREAGRYAEMREQARAALDLVPGSRAEEMKKLIHGLLGPTALDDPDAEEEETTGALGLQLPEPGQLKLGKGLRLLDDGAAGPGHGVSLSGGARKGSSGTKTGRPLLLLQDAKKLPGGDSDSRLELKP
jgi:tetratricopeptide (TPR) repeat protein